MLGMQQKTLDMITLFHVHRMGYRNKCPITSNLEATGWDFCYYAAHFLGNVVQRVYAQLRKRQLPTTEFLGSKKLFSYNLYGQKIMPKYCSCSRSSWVCATISLYTERKQNGGCWAGLHSCPGLEAELALQLLGMKRNKIMHKSGALKAYFLVWSQSS